MGRNWVTTRQWIEDYKKEVEKKEKDPVFSGSPNKTGKKVTRLLGQNERKEKRPASSASKTDLFFGEKMPMLVAAAGVFIGLFLLLESWNFFSAEFCPRAIKNGFASSNLVLKSISFLSRSR